MGTGSRADQFTATTKALASYSGRKCSDPQDIQITIERQKDVVIPIPTSRPDIEVEVTKLLPGKENDAYVKRSQQYLQNKSKIYSVALGQCTEAMKNRLEGEENYEDINVESDVIRLLLLIKSIAYSYESKSYPVLAIHMELKQLYASHQSNSSSCEKYFDTMSNMRNVISHCGSVIGNHPFLVDKFLKAVDTADTDNPTEEDTTTYKTAIEEAYMDTAFLSGMNNARYGALLNDLHNTFRMGHNEYPKTLTSAYNLSINWKGDTKGVGVTPNDGVAFTTESEEADIHITDGVKMTQTGKPVICHICGKNNYSNICPDREDGTPGKKEDTAEDTPRTETPPTKASVNLKIGEDWGDVTNYGGLMFCQVTTGTTVEQQHVLVQSGGHTKPTWVLLDNQYNMDIFSNRRLLKNIRKSDR